MTRAALRERLKRIGPIRSANDWVKARQQEMQAAIWMRRYLRRATALGMTSYSEDEVATHLRQRLERRGVRPVSKEVGELHVFLAFSRHNWEDVLPKEIARLGEVTEFEWRSKGYDESEPDWLRRRGRMNQEMLDAFRVANASRPVDAVVGYLSGWNTSPDAVDAMAAEGAVLFNFCFDDKLHYPGRTIGGRRTGTAALAASVDLNLTCAPESVLKYQVDGGLAIFWPEAASPDVHRPYDVPFELDVSFVGKCYGWRPSFVRHLERRGIRVEAFGSGWPNGPLPDDEMVRMYSRSRINLGFGGIGYSRRLVCLKGRDFEVPMAGGLYLAQHIPELERVYRVGEEIVTYRDGEECARVIRHLLEHPDEAARIRARGRERALRDHTWEARFTQAFRMAGILAP